MQFALLCEDAGYSQWCDPYPEAPMQPDHDKDDGRESANFPRLVFAVLGGVLLLIVVLVTNYPAVSEWISAAAQAEFVVPDMTPTGPTQIAQPVEQMHIVRSN